MAAGRVSAAWAVPAPGGVRRGQAMSATGGRIHRVRLEVHERKMLQGIVDGGRGSKERRRRAHILLLACSEPPEGHARWSLRPLGEKLVELEVVDGISKETARRALRKTTSSPG